MIPGAVGAAGLTVMVMGELVAVVGFAHGAFDVITTVTTSPLTRELVENEGLFVPALVPFTCH